MTTRVHLHRIVTDDAGETHWEDRTVELEQVALAPPAAPVDFVSLGEATQLNLMAGDASWDGAAFHTAPARQYMFILRGSGAIRTSDGEERRLTAGEVVLLEDTTGAGHSSRLDESMLIAFVRIPEATVVPGR
jgi:hypothetical protein